MYPHCLRLRSCFWLPHTLFSFCRLLGPCLLRTCTLVYQLPLWERRNHIRSDDKPLQVGRMPSMEFEHNWLQLYLSCLVPPLWCPCSLRRGLRTFSLCPFDPCSFFLLCFFLISWSLLVSVLCALRFLSHSAVEFVCFCGHRSFFWNKCTAVTVCAGLFIFG